MEAIALRVEAISENVRLSGCRILLLRPMMSNQRLGLSTIGMDNEDLIVMILDEFLPDVQQESMLPNHRRC